MDTSKTYIKMCEKAKEIQVLRKGNDNYHAEDWLVLDATPPFSHWSSVKNRDWFFPTIGAWERQRVGHGNFQKNKYIWLPSQDQLQEMVKLEPFMDRHWWFDGISRTECLIWGMVDLVDAGQNDYIFELNDYAKQFNSMEQYWLALVMKQKGKVWDGEDWVLSK